jgi:hypothetical protein
MRIEEFLGNKIPVEWFGEDEMPKDVKFPRREEEEHDEEEGGEESPSHRGRDRDHRRGRRDDRGRRGPRPERSARASAAEAPVPAAGTGETAEAATDTAPERAPKEYRQRGPRNHRREDYRRDRRRDRPMDRRPPREGGAGEKPLPSQAPSPLTGNPVIYCMKTGKPKNRTDQEFRQTLEQYDSRLRNAEDKFAGKKKAAPAIIKKISSKVTALFGNRGK